MCEYLFFLCFSLVPRHCKKVDDEDSTCTSSIYASTYDQITVEFGISRIVATLGLSLFVVGLGLGPLFLSPLSEVCACLSQPFVCSPSVVESQYIVAACG